MDEPITDVAFIRALRKAVDRYLRAVDSWEQEYRRFSDGAKSQRTVPPDLEQALSEYVAARQALTDRTPRSRRLCLKFGVRDPFPGLLRVELGGHVPHVKTSSVVGRNERLAIAECLAELETRCIESEHADVPPDPPPSKGILRRILDFFV